MDCFTTTRDKSVPSAPPNVLVCIISDTQFGVTWDPPRSPGGSPITKYSVQWDTDSSFDFQSVFIPSKSSHYRNSYIISGLDSSTSYWVRVIAYNAYEQCF